MVLMYKDGVTPIRVKSNEALARLDMGYTLEPKKPAEKQAPSEEKVAENKAVSARKVDAVEEVSGDSSLEKRKYTKKDSK